MAEIKLDTKSLGTYARRLDDVNTRISNLDSRMDKLYFKVGLIDLFKLIQADILTGYNGKIKKCRDYLNKSASSFNSLEKELRSYDPVNFVKPPSLEDEIFNIGTGIKNAAEGVKSYVFGEVDDAVESYYSHGVVYDVIEYGKATVKAGAGVVKIAAGVTSLIGTGGLSTPVSVLAIIGGANDIYNGINDGIHIYNDEYDKVGTEDFLKDKLTEGGRILGGWLGHEEWGETFGNVVYFGVDLIPTIEMLGLSMDKIKQLSSSNLGQVWSEVKEIAKIDISSIFTMDFQSLKYEFKLATYAFSATANFVENAAAWYGAAKDSYDIAKSVGDFISENIKVDLTGPLLKITDNLTGISTGINAGAKIAEKVKKYIFG